MKQFFDVITLKNVNINDAVALYLLPLEDGRYRFGATMQEPKVLPSDPETRIKHYFRITHQQFEHANHRMLFEDQLIKSAALTRQEVEEAFHLSLDNLQLWKFGTPLENQIIEEAQRLGMDPYSLSELMSTFYNFTGVNALLANVFSIQQLATLAARHNSSAVRAIRRPNAIAALQSGVVKMDELLNLHNGFCIWSATEPSCIKAIQEGLFNMQDLAMFNSDDCIQTLSTPQCLKALRSGVVNIQDLARCEDVWILTRVIGDECIQAISDGLITPAEVMSFSNIRFIEAILLPESLRAIKGGTPLPTLINTWPLEKVNALTPPCFAAIKEGICTLQEVLALRDPEMIGAIFYDGIGESNQYISNLKAKHFSLEELNQLPNIAAVKLVVRKESIEALQAGVFKVKDLATLHDDYSICYVIQPYTVKAIQEGIFTLQYLVNLRDHQTVFEITHPRCIESIRKGRFSIEKLAQMSVSEIKDALKPKPIIYNPELSFYSQMKSHDDNGIPIDNLLSGCWDSKTYVPFEINGKIYEVFSHGDLGSYEKKFIIREQHTDFNDIGVDISEYSIDDFMKKLHRSTAFTESVIASDTAEQALISEIESSMVNENLSNSDSELIALAAPPSRLTVFARQNSHTSISPPLPKEDKGCLIS